MTLTHIICFSGGHSSAIVAIEAARKYGKESVILLNHDINPRYEDADIKRFKKEVADYIGLPITYANYKGITNPEELPDQFDVCVEAGALTNPAGQALCTARLKTEPFYEYLAREFKSTLDLFQPFRDCVIYYGFDKKEKARIQRRSGILGAMGYKTGFILATWQERTIHSTEEIGITPPLTYALFEHANCVGCLKASLLHWYVVFVIRPDVYSRGIWMEEELDYTIHTVIRNGVKRPICLAELATVFERMQADGIPATEHQSKQKFANMIRAYQLEECEVGKPCECTD